MSELDPDSLLLQRVAGGDRRAFAALYRHTSARVLGLIVHVVRDRSQSEEVVQEVYLEVWLRAAQYDSRRGSAIVWMFRLAHSRSVDRVRSTESSRGRDEAAGFRELATTVAPVDQHLEDEEESARLRAAMDSLSPVQREAIRLTHLDGVSQAEASRRLGVPLGTIKTRVRQGLLRLRDELAA